ANAAARAAARGRPARAGQPARGSRRRHRLRRRLCWRAPWRTSRRERRQVVRARARGGGPGRERPRVRRRPAPPRRRRDARGGGGGGGGARSARGPAPHRPRSERSRVPGGVRSGVRGGVVQSGRRAGARRPRARARGKLAPAQHADVDRVHAAVPAAQVTISAPVTQLADAQACARRYQLLHELRLEERPEAEHPLADPLGDDASPPAALGTLAHRLLELIPLNVDPKTRRAELEAVLRLEGEDPAAHAEVLDAACAFLDSPLARRMAAAPANRLYRE